MKKLLLSLSLYLAGSLASFAQNNALQFDGTNDLCTATGGAALGMGGDGMAITCWAYLQNTSPNTTSYDGICGVRNNTDADFYILHYTASTLECRFRNSAGTNFDLTAHGITLNQWQHFVFTYDGTMLRFYRNGLLTDSLAANGTFTNGTGAFYIGGLPYQSSIFYLQGKVDEVSFWNRPLIPSEIQCMASNGIDTASLGLQLYYKCDQGIANGTNTGITSLIDSKGHIDGTLSGLALTGTTSNFVPGAAAATATVGFLCPGGTYNFGSQLLSAAGNYTDTLTNQYGCDSIVALTLYQAFVDTSVTVLNGTFTSAVAGSTYYQWIDCGNGNAPVIGATSRSFTPQVNGSYAVVVQQGTCRDTSACHAITNVGVEELNAGVVATIQHDHQTKSILINPQR